MSTPATIKRALTRALRDCTEPVIGPGCTESIILGDKLYDKVKSICDMIPDENNDKDKRE